MSPVNRMCSFYQTLNGRLNPNAEWHLKAWWLITLGTTDALVLWETSPQRNISQLASRVKFLINDLSIWLDKSYDNNKISYRDWAGKSWWRIRRSSYGRKQRDFDLPLDVCRSQVPSTSAMGISDEQQRTNAHYGRVQSTKRFNKCKLNDFPGIYL